MLKRPQSKTLSRCRAQFLSRVQTPRVELLASLRRDDCDMLYIFAHGHNCAPATPALSAVIEQARHRQKSSAFARELVEALGGPESAGLDESADSWIKLTRSMVFSADLKREDYELKRHPIVFLNMCQSAISWPGAEGGFVEFFVARRAGAVIGTESTIPEIVADAFGRAVLRSLFAGETLGSSVLFARRELANSSNPLGLAYSVFGSSSSRLGGESAEIV